MEDDGIPKDATIVEAGPFCVTDGEINLKSNTLGGIWSGNGIVDTINGKFDTKIAGIGFHKIYYKITGVCGNSDSITIEVVDTLNPEIQSAGPFCISDNPIILNAKIKDGIWKGKGIIDSITGKFDPSIAGVGSHKISYTVRGTCNNKESITITIQDTLNPQILPVDRICPDADPIILEANVNGGIWSGPGITDSIIGTFDPTKVGSGSVFIYYTLQNACGEKDSLKITVTEKLLVNFSPPEVPKCYFKDFIELPFEITGTGIDLVTWDFGDGTIIKNKLTLKQTFKKYNTYDCYVVSGQKIGRLSIH